MCMRVVQGMPHQNLVDKEFASNGANAYPCHMLIGSHQPGRANISLMGLHIYALLSQMLSMPIYVFTCLCKLLKLLPIGWLSLHLIHYNLLAPLGN